MSEHNEASVRVDYLASKYPDTVIVKFEDEGHIYECYSPYLKRCVYSVAWWEKQKVVQQADQHVQEQEQEQEQERMRDEPSPKRARMSPIQDATDEDEGDEEDDDKRSCSSANTATPTIIDDEGDEDDIYTACYRHLFPRPPIYASAMSVTSVIKPYWADPDFDMMRRFCLKSTRGVYASCDTIDKVQAVWDARRDRGTLMHERFEHLANAYQQASDGQCSLKEVKRFIDCIRVGKDRGDMGGAVDVKLFGRIKRMLGISPGKLEFYRTEMRLFHPALHWPGSIDLLLYDSRREGWVIVDYKRTDPKKVQPPSGRSKMTARSHPDKFARGAPCMEEMRCDDYNKYGIQLSLYRYILERVYNMKIVGMKIVAVDREIEESSYLQTPNHLKSLVGQLESNMALRRDEATSAWLDIIDGNSRAEAKKRGARAVFVHDELERILDSYIHVVDIPLKKFDRQIAFVVSERAKQLLKDYGNEMPDPLIDELNELIC